jgi:hypothetical protein
MTRNRWWVLLTVLAVALAGTESQAATKAKSAPKKVHASLVSKTYPVADLIGDSAGEDASELLIKFVKHAVKPASWEGHGGKGSVEYYPLGKALVIKQTPAVHAQLSCLLKALVKLQADSARNAEKHACCGSAMGAAAAALIGSSMSQGVVQAACPAPPAPMCCPTAKSSCKQYGHFVMDDIKVNAMGVSTTIKKIKFMYKGDGIEADVAKCAMTNGDSERKGDLEKLMKQVSDLVDAQKEKKEEPKEKKQESKVQTLPECGCKECDKCDKCDKCDGKCKMACPAPTCAPTAPACCPYCPAPAPCATCPKCDPNVTKCTCEEKTENKDKCEEKKKQEDKTRDDD